MSDVGGPLGLPADVPEPIRIPEPPGGFPPGRKPKKSGQKRQSRLPVASLVRAGIVIVVAAIVVLVIVIVITAVQQH
jgi:hypothetical protein